MVSLQLISPTPCICDGCSLTLPWGMEPFDLLSECALTRCHLPFLGPWLPNDHAPRDGRGITRISAADNDLSTQIVS